MSFRIDREQRKRQYTNGRSMKIPYFSPCCILGIKIKNSLAQNRATCTCFLALICNFATNTVFAYRMNRKVVYSAYSQVKVRVDIVAIVFTTEELLVVPFPTSTNPRSFIHALTQ